MTDPLTIWAVSGSRADYGLLAEPLRSIQSDPALLARLIVTGQHLVKSAGDSAERVRLDGFDIAAYIDLELSGDDAQSITAAAARALRGMGDVLATGNPDLLLLPGDRYEILCCALAATIARIPIAHIAGGDVTEGAFDDGFRHAISKLAQLHFPTNADAARRLRQLGETPDRVHVVGSPALDLIARTPIPARDAFFASIGFVAKRQNLLVTFHPVTLAADGLSQLDEMLAALGERTDTAILFTGANADPDGRTIDARIEQFVAGHPAAKRIASLGPGNYFAALAHMDAVVGNSSSGLYEAPSFGVPTVNVGDRQKGRLRAASVFDCPPARTAIKSAIDAALARGRQPTANPYGDGHASEKIVAVLKGLGDPRRLLRKSFVDMPAA